jgi:hypothetical protein
MNAGFSDSICKSSAGRLRMNPQANIQSRLKPTPAARLSGFCHISLAIHLQALKRGALVLCGGSLPHEQD